MARKKATASKLDGFIITQQRDGMPLRMKGDVAVPVGNSPQTRQATIFADADQAALAARTFTHKGTQGRPPKVNIVPLGEQFTGEIRTEPVAESSESAESGD